MSVDVKVGVPPLPNFSRLWVVYFFLFIGIIGFSFAYCLVIPLCLIGRLYRPAWTLGGRILRFSIDLLLKCQPWFEARVDLSLPIKAGKLLGPFITVSNHRSHLDMFILLASIPNIRVIAKRSLLYVPFLGVMMAVIRNIWITKGDAGSYWKAMNDIVTAVDAGDPVHIFPEMTRCPYGYPGVQEFHLAPFHALLKTSVPIIPVVFRDTDRVWRKGKLGIASGEIAHVKSLAPVFARDFKTADELKTHIHREMENHL